MPVDLNIKIKVLECRPFSYKSQDGGISPLIHSAYKVEGVFDDLPDDTYLNETYVGAVITAEYQPSFSQYRYIQDFMYPTESEKPCEQFIPEKEIAIYREPQCCDTMPPRGLCALSLQILRRIESD